MSREGLEPVRARLGWFVVLILTLSDRIKIGRVRGPQRREPRDRNPFVSYIRSTEVVYGAACNFRLTKAPTVSGPITEGDPPVRRWRRTLESLSPLKRPRTAGMGRSLVYPRSAGCLGLGPGGLLDLLGDASTLLLDSLCRFRCKISVRSLSPAVTVQARLRYRVSSLNLASWLSWVWKSALACERPASCVQCES